MEVYFDEFRTRADENVICNERKAIASKYRLKMAAIIGSR